MRYELHHKCDSPQSDKPKYGVDLSVGYGVDLSVGKVYKCIKSNNTKSDGIKFDDHILVLRTSISDGQARLFNLQNGKVFTDTSQDMYYEEVENVESISIILEKD